MYNARYFRDYFLFRTQLRTQLRTQHGKRYRFFRKYFRTSVLPYVQYVQVHLISSYVCSSYVDMYEGTSGSTFEGTKVRKYVYFRKQLLKSIVFQRILFNEKTLYTYGSTTILARLDTEQTYNVYDVRKQLTSVLPYIIFSSKVRKYQGLLYSTCSCTRVLHNMIFIIYPLSTFETPSKVHYEYCTRTVGLTRCCDVYNIYFNRIKSSYVLPEVPSHYSTVHTVALYTQSISITIYLREYFRKYNQGLHVYMYNVHIWTNNLLGR